MTPCFAIHFYGRDRQTVLKRRVYELRDGGNYHQPKSQEGNGARKERSTRPLVLLETSSPPTPRLTGVKTRPWDGPA